MKKILHATFLMFFCLNGYCEEQPSLEKINFQIIDLDKKFNELKKEVRLITKYIVHYDRFFPEFNLKDKGGYQRIDSESGMFYLIVTEIEKKGEFATIKAKIGNPQNCEFYNVKLTTVWENEKGINKELSVTFPTPLLAGHWNDISFILGPITDQALEKVTLSLETPSIRFPQKNNVRDLYNLK